MGQNDRQLEKLLIYILQFGFPGGFSIEESKLDEIPDEAGLNIDRGDGRLMLSVGQMVEQVIEEPSDEY